MTHAEGCRETNTAQNKVKVKQLMETVHEKRTERDTLQTHRSKSTETA